ncbi:MAG: winged helix-turn-helix domain-containing protein [Acidimicrobiales bacterium]
MVVTVFALLVVLTPLVATSGAGRPRARRDFAGMEQRRKRAGRLFARGVSQADVARDLEVSRQSVSRWYADWQAGGATALKGAGRAGRLPRLSKTQLRAVDRALRKGPRAHGYSTDLWTLARVGAVIEAHTGVAYHPGHVWKILRDQLGWSRQRPAKRAVERDDDAVANWVAKQWPRIKRGPVGGAPGSSSRTSRGSRSSPR